MIFGVYTDGIRTVQQLGRATTTAVAPGRRHAGADGMTLYVDGMRVAATQRHHRASLQRLLAGRRRQPRRLAEPADEQLLRRRHRRGRDLPDRPSSRHQVAAPLRRQRPHAQRPGAPTDTYGEAVYDDSPTCTGASTRPRARPRRTRPATGTPARTPAASTSAQPARRGRRDGHGGDVRRRRRHRGLERQRSRTRRPTPRSCGSRPPRPGRQAHRLRRPAERHVGQLRPARLHGRRGQLLRRLDRQRRTSITSPRQYNDGKWHHVVATQGRAA